MSDLYIKKKVKLEDVFASIKDVARGLWVKPRFTMIAYDGNADLEISDKAVEAIYEIYEKNKEVLIEGVSVLDEIQLGINIYPYGHTDDPLIDVNVILGSGQLYCPDEKDEDLAAIVTQFNRELGIKLNLYLTNKSLYYQINAAEKASE